MKGMIFDSDTDTVFISSLLAERHPEVSAGLRSLLGDRLRTITGAKDIWCRDYMPVQIAPDRFVQFRYDPDYLKDDPDLRTENGAALLGVKGCTYSDLVLDGGNVVLWRDAAILTDKVYRENPGIERPRLRDELRRLLEVERLVIIPKEPGDIIGHSDGVMRFVDERTLLVNDYRDIDPAFKVRLEHALKGFKIIPFPYRPTDQPGPDPEIPPASGAYINFLQVEGLIVCPTFGLPDDDRALGILRDCFRGQQVEPLACGDLAAAGGVLNCVTWNIKADGQ